MDIYSILFDVGDETGGQDLGVGDFKSEYEGDGGDGGTVLVGGAGNSTTINVVVGGSVFVICVLTM